MNINEIAKLAGGVPCDGFEISEWRGSSIFNKILPGKPEAECKG